jgi:DNA polymerase elongation subunit (family B)
MPNIHTLVFDIETAAFPFESYSETDRDYLLKYADDDDDKDLAIKRLNLYAMTAQVVSIGLLDVERGKGKVFYQPQTASVEGRKPLLSEAEAASVTFEEMTEGEILTRFWDAAKNYSQFVSFNGNKFDVPFLNLRSALLRIRPSKNILSKFRTSEPHTDLLSELTYHGATRKFNLEFYCNRFGVTNPKDPSIHGEHINQMFTEGRTLDIAESCWRDCLATSELYAVWKAYLKF